MSADLPATAHAKTVTAVEEFASLSLEYCVLLDTQRALLAAGNIEGAAETVARGDGIARRAAACGRRVAPWREAVESQQYSGPRAGDLVRRLRAATLRAHALAAGAAQIEAICLAKRGEAATEMRPELSSAPQALGLAAAYCARTLGAQLLDKQG